MNDKFSNGPSALQVHKSEDIEKSMGRIKKPYTDIFFCSSKHELSDGNNLSQQLLTFCCLHMRL